MRSPAAIIAVLSVLLPVPALTAEPSWEPIGSSDPLASVEIDRASLERDEGLVTVWLRFEFAAPMRGRVRPFQSVLAQYAVDCSRRRHAAIRMTTYSEALGNGEVIDRWDRNPEAWVWRTAGGDPADAAILRIACDQAPATVLSNAMTSNPA